MVIRAKLPQRAETQESAALTKQEKLIGVCLLLIYLGMIAVTIATSPYLMTGGRSIFERASSSF
jgi:hypothetical protein